MTKEEMNDHWTENAAKLHDELTATQIELSAADDVIAANAGGWFAAMGANEKASVIATMRNLATIDVHADKFNPTSTYSKVAGQPSYKFDVAAQVSTDADLRKHTITFGKTADAHKVLSQSYQKLGVTATEFADLQPKP